ncbi:tRNA (adenosine(37)-N6)-threonylcarbamoyltransferase complex transferase subunit TsaD [bacterium]|nr:tRNA (adenosine(37)-N6)-threonylcarbamoyltransferase complex transferase subunit TsaD [bacterium]
MKILAIETSCDDTAISIIEGDEQAPFSNKIRALSNIIHSQIEVHAPYGGVFPSLAKREHGKNLVPVLHKALKEASLLRETATKNKDAEFEIRIKNILEREPELSTAFMEYIPSIEIPAIDAIAVTYGPGLPPALWTGVNFAKALASAWKKPIIPMNHLEGHIIAALMKKGSDSSYFVEKPHFPALALLISGGHTELILISDFLKYKIVGRTRDDAVGEAFDKVARMLGLPYPGGPPISHLAGIFRSKKNPAESSIAFTPPMLHSGDFDFSFSGIKTAVLSHIKKTGDLTDEKKEEIACAFENAVTEVLVKKTIDAASCYGVRAILVGGGVSANRNIKNALERKIESMPGIDLFFPSSHLSLDNALMIAAAALLRVSENPYILKRKMDYSGLEADGNAGIHDAGRFEISSIA